jgi:hypothetical protein
MVKNTRGVIGLMTALLLSSFALTSLAQNPLTDIPDGDEGMVTGPKIGEHIPDFTALDQNGALLGFDDIKGPNGAMILFHRSADW